MMGLSTRFAAVRNFYIGILRSLKERMRILYWAIYRGSALRAGLRVLAWGAQCMVWLSSITHLYTCQFYHLFASYVINAKHSFFPKLFLFIIFTLFSLPPSFLFLLFLLHFLSFLPSSTPSILSSSFLSLFLSASTLLSPPFSLLLPCILVSSHTDSLPPLPFDNIEWEFVAGENRKSL